jgi:uncharacterized protein (TIGR03118 family)
MRCGCRSFKCLLFFSAVLLIFPALTFAQQYQQTNLVSDIPGMAPVHDGNLQNPWGLTRSPGGPWWVSNNNSGTSTIYDGNGNIMGAVIVPAFNAGGTGSPTGIVWNGSPTDFLLKNGKSAHFIFATEDGTISAWNGGAEAEIKVDNSDNGSPNGAVYKGATSGEIKGKKYLYVANFRSGKVEAYDTTFTRAHLGDDAFETEDAAVPTGFAPFNVQNIGGELFVTYAMQDSFKHDPVGGDGLGYVEIFTPAGKHIGHLQHGNQMNAPWGVVWTTRDFGEYSNAILLGNFRSGWIGAYDGFTHQFLGFLQNTDNYPLTIDGLWALTFGNDGSAGLANTLYFSAGIENELHGLFGTITPVDGLDGDEE